ncbi:MAG: hypothetical protein DHS20C13_04260 [Thermodesulfobacteriota bacterium]|nr:MAG: hypothetical protein DHS20C13_04260 [Thermodesulfobacteriota bacterium]
MHNEKNNEKDWFAVKYFIIVPALVLALMLQASCSIEQTEEGELPDVNVEVESGKLPDYDIDIADVDIKTEKKTVTVPKVVMEEKIVEVPTLEVDMPDTNDGEDEKKTE